MFVSALLALAVQASEGPKAHPELTALLLERGHPRETHAGFLRLAEANVPGAQVMADAFWALGVSGQGGDFPAACRIWESAAATSAEAAHFTAECYEHGHGGVRDIARAVELYRQAGEGGFPKSLCALGNLHMAGRGVPRDPAQAAALCRRAAEMGDTDAQTDLGNFHLQGLGVAQDYAEAARWYALAADRGHPNAAFTLGVMHWNGDGVSRDRVQAERLWRTAFDNGRRDASLHLGDAVASRALRLTGDARRMALEEAAEWYVLAIENADTPADAARAETELRRVRLALGREE